MAAASGKTYVPAETAALMSKVAMTATFELTEASSMLATTAVFATTEAQPKTATTVNPDASTPRMASLGRGIYRRTP